MHTQTHTDGFSINWFQMDLSQNVLLSTERAVYYLTGCQQYLDIGPSTVWKVICTSLGLQIN